MGREWGWTEEMRHIVPCAGQLTYVYVFSYRLGIAMNPAVVEVGLGRECCGLRSAYHGSPTVETVNLEAWVVTTTDAPKKGLDTPRNRSCSCKSGTMGSGSRWRISHKATRGTPLPPHQDPQRLLHRGGFHLISSSWFSWGGMSRLKFETQDLIHPTEPVAPCQDDSDPARSTG